MLEEQAPAAEGAAVTPFPQHSFDLLLASAIAGVRRLVGRLVRPRR